MNINKFNLLVAKVASKDVRRQNLNSVYFDTDGTLATDGHKIVKIGYPEQYPTEELPTKEPISGEAKDLVPFLLPREAAAGLEKSQPKIKHMPILNNIFLDVTKTNSSGSAHFMTTTLDSESRPAIKKMDYTFPPYKQVIPQQKDRVLRIGFNCKYMAEICEIASKMGLEECVFEFYGDVSPVKITGKNKETGQDFMALVMPIKLEKEPEPQPEATPEPTSTTEEVTE